jgi:transposase-like protein
MLRKFNSLHELYKELPDEQACVEYLEWVIWKGQPVSPFDPTSKIYKCKDNQNKCRNTGKLFNVRYGTMFHRSSVPLQKWYVAIWIFMSHRKDISSVQLGKDIGVTQKTAWLMLQRIRKCFGEGNTSKLDGVVEIDETFVGGKNKNRHWDKKVPHARGRSFKDKTPVFGMVQRGGKVVAKVVKNTQAKTLSREIHKTIKIGSTIYSDEWNYGNLNRRYRHEFVEHCRKQYAVGEVTTNSIESFWAILKRAIIGIYHNVSRKYLQNYANEFVFRYNTRNFAPQNTFSLILANSRYITLKDLTYAD